MSDTVLEADHRGDDRDRKAFADAVIAGLSQAQKSLPTAYLYDRRGSELFEDITELPNLVAGLEGRGWTSTELDAVLGGNWMRVYRRVWDG